MKTHKLSTHLTVVSAVALFVALAIFTVIEFFIKRDASFGELLTHHVAEAGLLAAIIWGVMAVSVQRLLVKPLEEIFVNLYAIGKGRQEGL